MCYVWQGFPTGDNMLLCVTMCFNAPCVAMCDYMLVCVTMCCNELLCVTICCYVLCMCFYVWGRVAICDNVFQCAVLLCVTICCYVWRCFAMCCYVRGCVAMCDYVLLCVKMCCCNVLLYMLLCVTMYFNVLCMIMCCYMFGYICCFMLSKCFYVRRRFAMCAMWGRVAICDDVFQRAMCCYAGREITASQRTMYGQNAELSSQILTLPVILTGKVRTNLHFNYWLQ
jgi:hypothetical protein